MSDIQGPSIADIAVLIFFSMALNIFPKRNPCPLTYVGMTVAHAIEPLVSSPKDPSFLGVSRENGSSHK